MGGEIQGVVGRILDLFWRLYCCHPGLPRSLSILRCVEPMFDGDGDAEANFVWRNSGAKIPQFLRSGRNETCVLHSSVTNFGDNDEQPNILLCYPLVDNGGTINTGPKSFTSHESNGRILGRSLRRRTHFRRDHPRRSFPV